MNINLKNFIKNIGMALAILFVLQIANIDINAKNSAKYWLTGFTEAEKVMLRQAVSIAVNRMQEPYIRDKGYELSSRYSLSPNAMRNSNILDTNQNRWDLLYYQLSWLAQPIGERKNGITAFPNIRIIGGYEAPVAGKLDWAGRAQLDLVQLRSVGGNVQQNGEFKIELNRYHTLDPEYQDPNVWAGIIVHEMLHNLGHDHANGYEIKYQVNVMGDVVQTDGGDYTQSYISSRNRKENSILENLNCDRSDWNELNFDLTLGESEETTIAY